MVAATILACEVRTRVSPTPVVLTIFEHPQKFRLQCNRKLTDLIEQQGSIARFLEKTRFSGTRSGERTLGMAEQLRLQ